MQQGRAWRHRNGANDKKSVEYYEQCETQALCVKYALDAILPHCVDEMADRLCVEQIARLIGKKLEDRAVC